MRLFGFPRRADPASPAGPARLTRLIVGLGNPENDYKGTRHNVGFEVLNKLAYDNKINIDKAKFRAHIGEGVICGARVMLAKPQTYMNLSGESVREILAYYKLTPRELIVVYDDTDIPVGGVRIRERGSAGGHNGMKSVIYQLDTDEFLRVRVGIGQKPPRYDLADYVLSRFKPDEQEPIIQGITRAGDAVELILKEGAQAAMNKFNQTV